MKIEDVRLHNLKLLVSEQRTLAAVADASETSPAYLSQILTRSRRASGQARNVGPQLARKLEHGCGKPDGWMDIFHSCIDNDVTSLSQRLMELGSYLPRGWQADLARACDVKPPSVADWLSGKSKTMGGENLLNAAAFFYVNPTWLAAGKGMKEAYGGYHASEVVGRVPLISWMAAERWRDVVDNSSPCNDATEWVKTTITVNRYTYALRVQSDSMEPKFPNGANIIVEPEEAKDGNYVIVQQGSSEPFLRQLVTEGGQKHLKPCNNSYPIIPLHPDALFCGVVKHVGMDV